VSLASSLYCAVEMSSFRAIRAFEITVICGVDASDQQTPVFIPYILYDSRLY